VLPPGADYVSAQSLERYRTFRGAVEKKFGSLPPEFFHRIEELRLSQGYILIITIYQRLGLNSEDFIGLPHVIHANRDKAIDFEGNFYIRVHLRQQQDLSEEGVLDYNKQTMSDATDLNAVAAELKIPREIAKRYLEQAAAEISERENMDRAPAALRPIWETDRKPDEDPARFAARAYAAEMAAGTLHRGTIRREDPELHRRLNSWLRSHDMPEGVDIPTLPEWNTRQLAQGVSAPTRSAEVRRYERDVKRSARGRYRNAL
jgi:hypothetical protein